MLSKSISEKIGTRGFICNVQHIGNGKYEYKRHFHKYLYTQKMLNKWKNKRPTSLNIKNIINSEKHIAIEEKSNNLVQIDKINTLSEIYIKIKEEKEYLIKKEQELKNEYEMLLEKERLLSRQKETELIKQIKILKLHSETNTLDNVKKTNTL